MSLRVNELSIEILKMISIRRGSVNKKLQYILKLLTPVNFVHHCVNFLIERESVKVKVK